MRRAESFRRLALTDFKVDIPRAPKKTVLAKALQESGMFWGRVDWVVGDGGVVCTYIRCRV